MNPHMYPSTIAVGKTDTSYEAAVSIDAKTWMRRVLDAVRDKPSTMSEVAVRYNVLATTTRPRASQLAALGKIRDSGKRRKNQWGKNEIVYEVVPEQGDLF